MKQTWLGGGNSNICYFHPDLWGNGIQFDLRIFFKWVVQVQPPPRWHFCVCFLLLPGGYLIWRIPEDDSEAWMGGWMGTGLLHLVRPIYLQNWVVVGGKW